MGLLALVCVKYVKPCSLIQFEPVGSFRLARANQPLPFGTASDVLDVSPVTVGQSEVFSEVLHVTAWAFYVESSLQHGVGIDWVQRRLNGVSKPLEQVFAPETMAHRIGYRSNLTAPRPGRGDVSTRISFGPKLEPKHSGWPGELLHSFSGSERASCRCMGRRILKVFIHSNRGN
jgi:hypothetical protein